MTPEQEVAFERKADKYFKSHRPCPPGRNNWAWELRKNEKADKKFRGNFDQIFPNAPGVGI